MLNSVEDFGNQYLTPRRVTTYALMALAVLILTYGYGFSQRRGLIDGFGHVIGGDLLALRIGGQLVRDGAGARLYDFELQHAYQQQVVFPEPLPGDNPFVTPPYVALVFWPWTFLPHGSAFAIWTLLSVGSIGLSLYLAMKRNSLAGSRWRLGLLLSLSFYPVLEGLMAGNTSCISLLVYTVMYLALKAGRDVEAGAFLGVLLIKPQLVTALAIVLIYKKRWRALLGLGAVAAIWEVLSISFVDQRSLLAYAELLPDLTTLAFVPGFPASLFTSVYAFFLVPLGPDRAVVANAAGAILSLGILIFVLRSWAGPWQTHTSEFDRRFSLTMIATCLISQYVLLHDLTILILAAVLIVNYWLSVPLRIGWGRTRVAIGVLWIVCLVGPPVAASLNVLTVPLALLLVGAAVGSSRHVAATARLT